MDPAVTRRLNAAINEVLEQPEVRQKLVSTGNTVRIETPEMFRETLRRDRQRWGELVRSIGVQLE
jgi:tripartite-type tricarboxylate transporter receptor subunit TctC